MICQLRQPNDQAVKELHLIIPSVFSLHKCGEAIKRKYRWLKLMITTFLRCQLRYIMLRHPLMYNQNENDKEAESLEGLQLYLRNVTRVWNVIWKVTFVQKFARDSREPHLQQSWFFSCLAILGFSRIYKRKPCGECPFIIFCIKYRTSTLSTQTWQTVGKKTKPWKGDE